jgi:CheY-like chemotaxis protein
MKKILVVDDESDICLTLANEEYYDLLILDIKMDKMSGLELYEEIKKIDNNVKVCFLTASKFNYKAFIDVLSDPKENQIIQKPIRNEELIKIINDIIN